MPTHNAQGTSAEEPKPENGKGVDALVSVPVLAAAFLGAGLYAYYTVFSRFAYWDDEGTLLLMAKQFVDGHVLYDEVRTWYGPFYYLSKWFLHGLLGLPVSHDVTRVVHLAYWLATPLCCSLVALRVTKWLPVAVVVFVQTVLQLRLISQEPGHPQELCVCLIATALLLATYLRPNRLSIVPAAGTGALVAALLLTKINLGVYLTTAVAFALLAHAPRSGRYRHALFLAVAASLSLPAAVMWRHIPSWGFSYWTTVTLTLLPLVLVTLAKTRPGGVTCNHLVSACVGAFVAMVVVVLFLTIRGTSLSALIQCTFLTPLSISARYTQPALLPPYGLAVGLTSLALCLAYLFGDKPLGIPRNVLLGLLNALRVAFLLFVIVEGLVSRIPVKMMSYVAPFLWLLTVPAGAPKAREDEFAQRFPRDLVALIAALQLLAAYPVFASQTRGATFLLVLAGGILLADALSALQRSAPDIWDKAARSVSPRLAHAAAAVIVLAVYFSVTDVPGRKQRYERLRPLSLPGAHRIRTTDENVAVYHWLVNNVSAHLVSFVTLPNMASLYLWTGKEPPLNMVEGLWMAFMSDEDQHTVVRDLAQRQNMGVVHNPWLVEFWRATDTLDRPVPKFLLDNYTSLFVYQERFRTTWRHYEFLVHKDRDKTALFMSLLWDERTFATYDDVLPLPIGCLNTGAPLTVTAWVKTRAPGVILGLQSAPYPYLTNPMSWCPLLFVGPDGSPRAKTGQTTPEIVGGGPIDDGQWHHLTLTCGPQQQTLYVDGHPAVSANGTLAVDDAPFAQLGAGYSEGVFSPDPEWGHFSGNLSDLRLFPRLLTQSEVRDLHDAGPKRQRAGLDTNL